MEVTSKSGTSVPRLHPDVDTNKTLKMIVNLNVKNVKETTGIKKYH